jgi:hypothetical protein
MVLAWGMAEWEAMMAWEAAVVWDMAAAWEAAVVGKVSTTWNRRLDNFKQAQAAMKTELGGETTREFALFPD